MRLKKLKNALNKLIKQDKMITKKLNNIKKSPK
jgi:hypothetical protein